MKKTTILAGFAIVSAMIATPVLAQDVTPRGFVRQGAYDSNTYYRGNQNLRRNARYYNAARYGDNWGRRDSGFWPGGVAAGIVGGAVGTAGAVASAPFRDAYAYSDPYYRSQYNSAYVARNDFIALNGFVCQPGTIIRAQNGEQQICQ